MHGLLRHLDSARDGLTDRTDEEVQSIALPALLDALQHAAVLALQLGRLFADASPGLLAAELMRDGDRKVRHGPLAEKFCSTEASSCVWPFFIPSAEREPDKG